MTPDTAYQVYHEPIRLFLDQYEEATPGLLQYHIAAKQSDINTCLEVMEAKGEIEPYGVELKSEAYQGQPLYRVKKFQFWQERAMVELALDHANEQLLGLHRYGVLTYAQYAEIATFLLDAREKLKLYIEKGSC